MPPGTGKIWWRKLSQIQLGFGAVATMRLHIWHLWQPKFSSRTDFSAAKFVWTHCGWKHCENKAAWISLLPTHHGSVQKWVYLQYEFPFIYGNFQLNHDLWEDELDRFLEKKLDWKNVRRNLGTMWSWKVQEPEISEGFGKRCLQKTWYAQCHYTPEV